MAKLARTVYQMGGGASTAILHGCHPQNTCGDALHGGGTCPAATTPLDVRLNTEGNCARENGTPVTTKMLSMRCRGGGCDALPSHRLERQRPSLTYSGSTGGKYARVGMKSPSAENSDVDEPRSTSNQAVEGAGTAGEEEDARCSSLENDDNGAMSKEEAAIWLNSVPASPASCSNKTDLSDNACGGGEFKPISTMWQSTPTRSRRTSHKVKTALVPDNREETSRHDTTAGVTRDDNKSCSTLSIDTSAKSTSGTAALSRAPNAHCCPASRKPRRDSFGASLQAAINTSSATIPKQLFQTHHGGGDDRSSSGATMAAVNGPQLQLPRSQQRHGAFSGRPTTTLATLRRADQHISDQILQEGFRPEGVHKLTRATAEAKQSQHRQPPSCLEVDQTSTCSSWMNDEEWLKVSLQSNRKCVQLVWFLEKDTPTGA